MTVTTQAPSERIYWERVERERERDRWWHAYRDALDAGEDMSTWLAANPYPGRADVAEAVRRQLEPLR